MRPYTIIFSTETLDGRIADPTGFSRLSCEEDFELQHMLRAQVDAVMVGSRTAVIDDPRLTVRLARGWSPLRVVVDSKLRVPPSARIFSAPGKGVLVTVEGHGGDKLWEYRRRGVIVVESGRGRVDLRGAMERLAGMGVRRLMVEGGGGLNYVLLKERLVDEVWVTLAPYVFGAGRSMFDGVESVRARLALYYNKILCGGWVHLRYRVVYS